MPSLFLPTSLNQALMHAACLLVNHLLAQQPALQNRLASVHGKTLGLSIGSFSGVFAVDTTGYLLSVNSVAAKSVSAKSIPETEASEKVPLGPDTSIAVPWSVVLNNLANPAAMRRAVQLQGDVDFAQTVVAVLSALRWDAELDLAKVVGEVPAVWAMRGLKAVGINAQQAFMGTVNAVREYLVYERGLLPSPGEVEAFRLHIEALRDQLARLEKRVDKLHHGQSRG